MSNCSWQPFCLSPHSRSVWFASLLAIGLGLINVQAALADVTSPTTATVLRQGKKILLNGRSYTVAWAQWQDSANPTRTLTGMSDTGLMRGIGLELLNSGNATQQPVQWFSNQSLSLKTRFSPAGNYRYLDVTNLAQQANWQLQANGEVLQINSPAAKVQTVRVGRQPWGERVVIELDQPTPWQINRLTNSQDGVKGRNLILTLDATANPTLGKSVAVPAGGSLKTMKLMTTPGQTTLEAEIAGSVRPEVSMLTNPNRLVIDIRPEPTIARDILWAPGVRWREQIISVGAQRYPVTWLVVDPRQPGIKLRPIWHDANALVGIDPLSAIAQRTQAAAAINGGYFNRDKQTPLGAIRRQGNWISSPILNRGAIAWNDNGSFQVGRLSLQEILTTSSGQRIPLMSLDSGFPQKGIARYTPVWGSSYTPLLKNETVVTVRNGQVINQVSVNSNNTGGIPIPVDGYLLVLRDANVNGQLAPGTTIQTQMSVTPAAFSQFSEILGAGPILVQNGQIVLDAQAEQFRPPFDSQGASRSGIGQAADGMVLLAAVHNRVKGAGPTLREWAQIMQKLGAVNALNLDGGSSTTLYLGGQLLDRHPSTAARVQNGVGVFIQAIP